MGADQHIDLAVFAVLENLLLLTGVAEAAHHLDARRGVAHALGKGLVVLLGEDGGRHQHRRLFVVADRLEGRAHRDLGLAVADVAADQAVHGVGRFHIALDLGHRAQLVGRLLEGKGRF